VTAPAQFGEIVYEFVRNFFLITPKNSAQTKNCLKLTLNSPNRAGAWYDSKISPKPEIC